MFLLLRLAPRHNLGNGVYGRAFARRLASCGVPVVVGSRSSPPAGTTPGRSTWALPCAVLPVADALAAAAPLVVLAIPHTAAAAFVTDHAAALHGKVLVDVANPVSPSFGTTVRGLAAAVTRRGGDADGGATAMAASAAGRTSTAERLAAVVAAGACPTAAVVKAFNNVSAYTLEEGTAQVPPPIVFASAEDGAAKAAVMGLARRMGFSAMDAGGLATARTQETSVHRFFDGWVAAVVVSATVLFLWSLYWANAFYAQGRETTALWYGWLLLPVGDVAAVLLAATFLPGSIAAAVQLARGTAKVPFPAPFASWLAIRKQLGMVGWWLATMHAVAGALHGAPRRSPTRTPTYDHYTYIAFGVIAYAFYLVLAMSSNPAVASGLSWTEFKFVFSFLGLLTMALTLVHLGIFVKLVAPRAADADNPVFTSFLAFGVLGVAAVCMLLCKVPPLSLAIRRVRAK